MLSAFLYGIVLAFGLIIPLGVQNVFLFNQGATHRRLLHAMPSVLAAFICDAILISVSVLGVSIIVLQLAWIKTLIFAIGFVFLVYMGWITWQTRAARLRQDTQPLSPKRQVLFAITVSILNPHALLDSIAVIGTNSLNFAGAERWAFALACMIISFCWFLGMAIAGHCIHKIDKSGHLLTGINKLSALIIWSVAIYIGWQLTLIFMHTSH